MRETCYRVIEGVSTGAMFLSLMGYSARYPHLLFCYLIHWIASWLYHLYDTQACYWGDITLINMVINERMALNNPVYAPIVFLGATARNVLCPPAPFHHVEIIVQIIIGTIMCFFTHAHDQFLYLTVLIMTGFFFGLSDWTYRIGERRLSMFFCLYYHLGLGLYSYLEAMYYYPSERVEWDALTSLLRYSSWFCYVFSQMTRSGKRTTYQTQSIVSLTAASVLAPLGLWETWSFFISGSGLSPMVRREVFLFYLAYCLADTYHGLRYYPQFFPLIEGWLHHGFTGGYILLSLCQGHYLPGCLAMVVETPSLILFSSRVFHKDLMIRWCKRHLFPLFFVLFRILVLGASVIKLFMIGEIGSSVVIFYLLFSLLNGHWILQMLAKNKRS